MIKLKIHPFIQHNLRNRVSYTTVAAGSNPVQYNTGTFYSYDIHGNVDTLVQDYGDPANDANIMNTHNNMHWKTFVYDYDLISGKVNRVQYQPDRTDGWIHRYSSKLGEFDWTNGGTTFYNYGYDQLNRLTRMDAYNNFNAAGNSWNAMHHLDHWKERIAYDGNGNILKYKRNGVRGFGLPAEMDSLNYEYYAGTNRLRRIRDSVPAGVYPNNIDFSDLDNQPDNNYVYDEIGNLIKDSSEKITNIKWSVYGKILEIDKQATAPAAATKITYTYDAQGNRISKTVETAGANTKTTDWYVRDAQGNVIAIYTSSGALNTAPGNMATDLTERTIYGSSRLGTYKVIEGMNSGPNHVSSISAFSYQRGLRYYELTNHLGNVEAVITDKKYGVPSDTNSSLIAYYKPDFYQVWDYAPFGWPLVGRTWEARQPYYRYGFNGKEFDHEVKGKWNSQDYGMRMYDPKVGRFLSVDPLTTSYPHYTPYSFAGNKPISFVDRDGEEESLEINTRRLEEAYLSNKISAAEYSEGIRVQAMGGVIGTAIVTDVFFTKGKLTRFAIYSMLAGAFPHNPSSTPEGRALQDKTSKETLAEAFTWAGGGEILGKIFQGAGMLFSKAKTILQAAYSYGETTITTQVGKEMLEIGRGGIGSGGYLEMEINVKVGKDGVRVASGETVFEEIYKSAQANANAPINGIKGMWYSGSLGDNLNTFNKLILEKVNKGLMTEQEAALQTFTGKMATKKGFTNVKSIAGEKNADGTYKFVNSIIFTK